VEGVFSLLFRKRQKRGGLPPLQRSATDPQAEQPLLYRIEYEMMLKGSVCQRRSGPIRQYGVTVNGSTRLVTSGDVVDAATYGALLAAQAIRPVGAVTGEDDEAGSGTPGPNAARPAEE